jgi:hypothetical protein
MMKLIVAFFTNVLEKAAVRTVNNWC